MIEWVHNKTRRTQHTGRDDMSTIDLGNNEQISPSDEGATMSRRGFFMNEGKMNTKTAIAAIALLLPAAAIAEPTPHEFCTEMAGLAEVIMEGRQNGMPMPAMMNIAAQGSDTEINSVTEALVIDAFSHPRYGTERYKQNTIGDFADSAYLSCITTVR